MVLRDYVTICVVVACGGNSDSEEDEMIIEAADDKTLRANSPQVQDVGHRAARLKADGIQRCAVLFWVEIAGALKFDQCIDSADCLSHCHSVNGPRINTPATALGCIAA